MLAHERLGVSVLGIEMIDDRGVFWLIPVTHPGVIVGDLITVDLQNLWLFFGDRWLHI